MRNSPLLPKPRFVRLGLVLVIIGGLEIFVERLVLHVLEPTAKEVDERARRKGEATPEAARRDLARARGSTRTSDGDGGGGDGGGGEGGSITGRLGGLAGSASHIAVHSARLATL